MFVKTKKMIALVLVLCMMPVLTLTTVAVSEYHEPSNASNLIMKGKSDKAVPVTMTANKTALSSSVPASVAVYAKVDVVFKKGAEGSTVTTRKDGATANVQNKTRGQIELIGKTGSSLMESGEKG